MKKGLIRKEDILNAIRPDVLEWIKHAVGRVVRQPGGLQRVWINSPITGTGFASNAFSTTAKSLVNVATIFSGVPAGIRSIHLELTFRDSGSAATDCYVILGPTNTAGVGKVRRCSGLPNDIWVSHEVDVPCDSDGNFYIQVAASGALTMDINLKAWGWETR